MKNGFTTEDWREVEESNVDEAEHSASTSRKDGRILSPSDFYLDSLRSDPECDRFSPAEEKMAFAQLRNAREAYELDLLSFPVSQKIASGIVDDVLKKNVRIERTLNVGVADKAKKTKLRAVSEVNMETVPQLCDINKQEFKRALCLYTQRDLDGMREILERIRMRQLNIARLLREVEIRPELLESAHKKLLLKVHRLRDLFSSKHESETSLKSYQSAVLTMQETPTRLDKRISRLHELENEYLAIQQRCIKANMALVVSIAKRFKDRGVPFEDLITEGSKGLRTAVQKFELHRGWKFSTYAQRWIERHMYEPVGGALSAVHISRSGLKQLRSVLKTEEALFHEEKRQPTPYDIVAATSIKFDNVVRLQEVSHLPVSIEMLIDEYGDECQGVISDAWHDRQVIEEREELAKKENDRTLCQAALQVLEEREQRVIILRFGLDHQGARTLKEVGEELGITKERVRQIESKALKKMALV